MKGPDVGQDVYVLMPEGEPYNGRVDGVRDRTLLLAVEAQAFSELDGGACVQFTSSRGVCRVDGLLRGYDREFERVRFDQTGDVRLIQRRQHVRIDAVVSVSYRDEDGEPIANHTANVSGGGFLLASPAGLAIGDENHFTLHLDEDGEINPLDVFGRVVRQTDGSGLGVQIEQISSPDRERLIRWVFGRERLARQLMKKS